MTALFQVACRPLDWDLSAADALRLVRHDPHPVALLGAWADGSDIVASYARRRTRASGTWSQTWPGPSRPAPATRT
jgi:hypothetical protein